MTSQVITEVEECRDAKVRKVPCPNCKAPAGTWCDFGRTVRGYRHRQPCSHTGRYVEAQKAGLVPPWRGWPWMT